MMQGRWLMMTGAQKNIANKQPDKRKTSLAAIGTEEESARHKVALVQNLLAFTPYKIIRDTLHRMER